MRGLVSSIALLAAGLSYQRGLAQQQALRLTLGNSDALVRLESHESKTQFKLGDPITLDLVLTAESGGYTTFIDKNRFDFPQVNVTPATGWFQAQGQPFGSPEVPGQNPVRIPLLLNRSIVFQQPGYYKITITTTHLVATLAPAPEACCRETTNVVGIDILPRDEHEESELVAQLSSALEKKPDTFPSDDFKKEQKPLLDELDNVLKDPHAADPQRTMKLIVTMRAAQDAEIARIKKQKESRRQTAVRLSYLQGDDAVRAKVRWILADPEDGEDDTALVMLGGLIHSRNQPLQLQMLQTAWSDIGRVPTYTLQTALQQAKEFPNHENFDLPYNRGAPVGTLTHAEVVGEHQRELGELLTSLPQRASPNRERTMSFLMSGWLKATDALRLRTEIEQVFGEMSPEMQNSLLRTGWPGLCDRAFPVPREPLRSSCGMTEPTGTIVPNK